MQSKASLSFLHDSVPGLGDVMWSAETGPDEELVFRQTLVMKGVCHEEEVFGRADRSTLEASGTGYGRGRYHSAGRDFRADILSLEETVQQYFNRLTCVY